MTTKMKGLLKGLRYISQIFEPNCKEQEMQIGFPTDVKHVAHIGWDGPSVNSSPSWMNEFRSAPLSCIGAEAMVGDQTPPKYPSQEIHRPRGIPDSPARDRDLSELPLPKPSRRHASSGPTSMDTPPRDSPSVRRQSRRNKSAGGESMESPSRDPSDGSTRPSRRHQYSSGKTGDESPLQDLPAIPKQSRRRKSKGSSGGGSSRSKALASTSFLDPESDGMNSEQNLVLKSTAEE